MEKFWIEAHRILLGLKVFLENDVVHHDLNPKNIVYDETKERINFIDFGLMTRKSVIMKESRESKYGFAVFHWSFPLEMAFMNEKTYSDFTSLSDKKKHRYYLKILNQLQKNEDVEIVNAISSFLYFAGNDKSDFLNVEKMKVDTLTNFIRAMSYTSKPGEKNYKIFLEKCINTIDIYGTGLAFLNVLKNTYKLIDQKFALDLAQLFLGMANANVYNRIEISTLIDRYETCLEYNGIMREHNMHFENHIIKEGSFMPQHIHKMIKHIDSETLTESVEKNKDRIRKEDDFLDPHKQCPPDKELNPLTNRCVKKCPPNKIRDMENFRCIGAKKRAPTKTMKISSIVKKCSPDKELNPFTNRCVKRCPEGMYRNAKFQCRKTKKFTIKVRKNKY